MLRLAFDFIIAWREIRARPNAYLQNCRIVPTLGSIKLYTSCVVTVSFTFIPS